MFAPTLLVSPAAMLPAVSSSNGPALAIVARGTDVRKSLDAALSATQGAADAVASTIVDAAKAAAAACAAAAKAGADALVALWTHCKHALERVFGTSRAVVGPVELATRSTTTTPAAMVPTMAPPPVVAPASLPSLPLTQAIADAAVAPLEPAETALFPPPAMTETATTTVPIVPTVAAAPVPSRLLTALLESPVELTTTTKAMIVNATANDNDTTSSTKTPLALTPESELERAPPAVVCFDLPQEVADQELVLDDHYTKAYRAALMTARHAAWGRTPVPNDTVLRIILCLHGRNNGRRFLLESPVAIVDVVLRALACHKDDVVAAFDALTRAWMPRYALFVALWESNVVVLEPSAIDAERRMLSCAFPWTPLRTSRDGTGAVDPVVG